MTRAACGLRSNGGDESLPNWTLLACYYQLVETRSVSQNGEHPGSASVPLVNYHTRPTPSSFGQLSGLFAPTSWGCPDQLTSYHYSYRSDSFGGPRPLIECQRISIWKGSLVPMPRSSMAHRAIKPITGTKNNLASLVWGVPTSKPNWLIETAKLNSGAFVIQQTLRSLGITSPAKNKWNI